MSEPVHRFSVRHIGIWIVLGFLGSVGLVSLLLTTWVRPVGPITIPPSPTPDVVSVPTRAPAQSLAGPSVPQQDLLGKGSHSLEYPREIRHGAPSNITARFQLAEALGTVRGSPTVNEPVPIERQQTRTLAAPEAPIYGIMLVRLDADGFSYRETDFVRVTVRDGVGEWSWNISAKPETRGTQLLSVKVAVPDGDTVTLLTDFRPQIDVPEEVSANSILDLLGKFGDATGKIWPVLVAFAAAVTGFAAWIHKRASPRRRRRPTTPSNDAH